MKIVIINIFVNLCQVKKQLFMCVCLTFNILSISRESKSFLPTVSNASATLKTISIPSDKNTSMIRQASGKVKVVVKRVRNQLLAYSEVLKLWNENEC